jgi:subtilisin family serine protease
MRGLGAALSILAVLGFPGAVTASHASQPASFVPGELLVRFASSTTASARAEDVLADLDATVVERLPVSGLVRVRLEPGTSVPAAAAALEQRAGVRYAQPNHRRRIDATPNDPRFLDGSLWGLHQGSDADIDAPEAWDITQGSNAVTVAVVDTGVQYTHPDLDGNMWVNDDPADGVHGWDFANNDSNPDDDHGHGTHVAGTIGAEGHNGTGVVGVNWRVKLMALKAADEDGFFADSSIVSAFSYACRNGARVINGSFGGDYFSQVELDAINACPGALFVFAAGNGGPDHLGDNNDVTPHYPCNYSSANVVCVAASNASDQRTSFSNYGRTSVDLAAPGQSILSTFPGSSYEYAGGTSMATPHVAGAAALVLADRPGLTTTELRRALLLGADAKASLDGLVATGARLNVRRALTQEVALPTVSALSSSPSLNRWSNVNSAVATWTATDASGVDGYSVGWSPDATFSPDEVKDVEENVTSSSTILPDGRTWFHVRARDRAGNWSDPVHLGPFQVDTFPPVRPILSSPSHRVGVASTDRTIELYWTGASDSISGVDGFSLAWGRHRLVSVDLTKDVEEGAVRATSATLAAGAWWFGIRARDNAGNWTDATVLGPFVVTAVATVCTVPRLRGLTLVGAKRRLVKQGCRLGRVTKTYSRRVRRGRVVGQRPAPGLRRTRGAKVAVVLSRGRRKR